MRAWARAGLFVIATALLMAGMSPQTSARAADNVSGYLDAVEDMPLMEGLRETGEGGIVFDKPNGRIVRTIAEGRVSVGDVRSFYASTLPQLGWVRLRKLELIPDLLVFDRETERLEIEIVPMAGSSTQVRFSIEPN
tara:strand:- start:1058 stop:1468 length:411 start_codon:yes stop_codon:yes gene_type:complete